MKKAKTLLSALLVPFLCVHAQAQVPSIINYQGRVIVGSANFNGAGQFEFALVDSTGAATYWSNDGTSTAGSQPNAAVTLTVNQGLYSVLLGDSTLTNMTAIPVSVFNNGDVRLRVWFNDGTHGWQLLSPDQRITAVGYAITATNLALPATTSSTSGMVTLGGMPFLHAYGTDNVFLGTAAGNFSLTGMYNTALGAHSLSSITTGSCNLASGCSSLTENTTGSGNTATGFGALCFNTAGSGNSAYGDQALNENTTGSNNAANGTFSLQYNTTGGYNTASGFCALYSNTSGSFDSADGTSALYSNTTGNKNTACGYQALYSNSAGTQNTAVGYEALQANTVDSGPGDSGGQNTGIGSYALQLNTTGYSNMGVGAQALKNNTTGSANAAAGMNGLESNTTGSFNTACGNAALYTNTTGSQNTATGYGALGYATGTGNIAVGYIAGSNLTTGNNNIDIFDPGLAAEASTIRIGTQGTQITTYIAGIQGTTLGTGTPVYVNANGQLGTVTSSRRFKTDIRDMGTASNVVLALRPVTFRYKPEIDPSTTPQYGLVAEEVAKVSPNLVVRDKNNQIYSVRYDAVNAMLLNEFQKEHEALLRQQREIEILKNEVNALKGNEQTSPASTSRAID